MHSNECWMGMHGNCDQYDYCDCMCHVKRETMFDDLMNYLIDGQ